MRRILPTWLWDRAKTFTYGWEFTERFDDLHQKYGKAFAVVSPSRIDFQISDPGMAWDLLSRRTDFIQIKISNSKSGSDFGFESGCLRFLAEIMGVFGPNLITVSSLVSLRHV